MGNFYFPQFIQELDQVEKNALVKQSELLLIRANKIVMLSFATLGMDLAMMSDKKGMLWRLAMTRFMSLWMDLIVMSDKKGELYLLL